MAGTFSLSAFVDAASPIITVIAGISFFIAVVVIAIGMMVARANPEERSDFFGKILWIVIPAFILGCASTITLLFFK